MYTCILFKHFPKLNLKPFTFFYYNSDYCMCAFSFFHTIQPTLHSIQLVVIPIKGVRSGVIHLTLKRTWGPAIQTHRRHQLPPLLFSPRFPCFIKDLPLSSPLLPLSLSLSCLLILSPSFTHFSNHSLHLFN